jgi:hypothetical protein
MNCVLLGRIQIAIGRRGAELLRVGGLMVYSTCSLNPIENEAVVAEILRKSTGTSSPFFLSLFLYSFLNYSLIFVLVSDLPEIEGKMQLIDLSDKLPGLKRRPGLNTWKVYFCYSLSLSPLSFIHYAITISFKSINNFCILLIFHTNIRSLIKTKNINPLRMFLRKKDNEYHPPCFLQLLKKQNNSI